MQNARRLYFYAVAFVSLETVLWSLIGLIRSFVGGVGAEGNTNRLAAGLSLILAGAPIFLLHAWWIQRAAAQDPEERFSRLRAIFLYGLLLATLIPVTTNLLALVNRWLVQALDLDPIQSLLGVNQISADNLIAIVANALAALGIFLVVRADWQSGPQGTAYPEVRRAARYFWLLYGLLMFVFGAQQLLYFVFSLDGGALAFKQPSLANGAALFLVGLPVWAISSLLIQRSLVVSAERGSMLRLVVLYVIALTSATLGLIALVVALDRTLGMVFDLLRGQFALDNNILDDLAGPLSLALSMGTVWFYYARQLNLAIQESARGDDEPGSETLWRAGLSRLYLYVLAFLGLFLIFAGLLNLLVDGLALLFDRAATSDLVLIQQAASGIATLVVGLPLWRITWRRLQKETALEGDAGDHARRSGVRKGYLFLVLFACVIGLMFAGGSLLYQLLLKLLGAEPLSLVKNVLRQISLVVLFSGFLSYHWLVLRRDARMAERSLGKRHAQFPVLILSPEDDGEFADQMFNAVQRQAPEIPVAVHPYSQGVPDETLSAARAVILPAELVSRPSEAFRLWLQAFQGTRLVIPAPVSGWFWVAFAGRGLPALARQAAQAVRQLAEGVNPSQPTQSSALQIFIYILAGLFALQLLGSFLVLVFALASN